MYITSNISALNSGYLSAKNSGLGNVLFQIASVMGIAKKKGLVSTFPNVNLLCDKLKRLYNLDYKTTLYRNIVTDNHAFDVTIKQSTSSKIYDESILNQIDCNNGKNIILEGYLENTTYFSEIIDEIKTLFSADENSLKYIYNKYNNLFDSKRPLISMHFRGNEYKNYWCANAIGVSTAHNYTYYENAIKYMLEHVENPLFLIFTDDINSIELNKFVNIDYIVINNNTDYIDLWLMSLCDHNILSFSTFSFWGAFLNKNKDTLVLYDKHLNYEYLQMFIPI